MQWSLQPVTTPWIVPCWGLINLSQPFTRHLHPPCFPKNPAWDLTLVQESQLMRTFISKKSGRNACLGNRLVLHVLVARWLRSDLVVDPWVSAQSYHPPLLNNLLTSYYSLLCTECPSVVVTPVDWTAVVQSSQGKDLVRRFQGMLTIKEQYLLF